MSVNLKKRVIILNLKVKVKLRNSRYCFFANKSLFEETGHIYYLVNKRIFQEIISFTFDLFDN